MWTVWMVFRIVMGGRAWLAGSWISENLIVCEFSICVAKNIMKVTHTDVAWHYKWNGLFSALRYIKYESLCVCACVSMPWERRASMMISEQCDNMQKYFSGQHVGENCWENSSEHKYSLDTSILYAQFIFWKHTPYSLTHSSTHKHTYTRTLSLCSIGALFSTSFPGCFGTIFAGRHIFIWTLLQIRLTHWRLNIQKKSESERSRKREKHGDMEHVYCGFCCHFSKTVICRKHFVVCHFVL